jgi:hypothetical protein
MAVVHTWSPEEVEQELRERSDGQPRLEAWFKRLVSQEYSLSLINEAFWCRPSRLVSIKNGYGTIIF